MQDNIVNCTIVPIKRIVSKYYGGLVQETRSITQFP